MNYVHLAGFLAKDPESRFTADGKKVTTLLIATNSKKGAEVETVWWSISLWGDRWDNMIKYLQKGKPVLTGGSIRKPRVYQDKNGNYQVGSLEVRGEYLNFAPSSRPDQEQGNSGQSSSSYSYGSDSHEGPQHGAASMPQGSSSYEDDSIPF
ncbi:MAG: single-stranded DNA-binding protein [Waddliaceae bacterium]